MINFDVGAQVQDYTGEGRMRESEWPKGTPRRDQLAPHEMLLQRQVFVKMIESLKEMSYVAGGK
jgi:hypothetical protein